VIVKKTDDTSEPISAKKSHTPNKAFKAMVERSRLILCLRLCKIIIRQRYRLG